MTEKEKTKKEVMRAIGRIIKKSCNKQRRIKHYRSFWKRDKEILRYLDKLESEYVDLFK